MYDIVYFPCPACGERVEDQPKSGDCTLRCMALVEAPPDVLRGLDLTGACPHCSRAYRLVITIRVVEEVRVHVECA